MDGLPDRVLKRISRLSRELNEPVETVVERGVALLEKRSAIPLNTGRGNLTKLVPDPKKRAIYREVMQVIGVHTSSKLSDKQKFARSSAGGEKRAQNLSAAARKKIAADAAKARWKKARSTNEETEE